MAGEIFYLKLRDTRPIFETALKNPDGTAYDLTGSTAWKLHIWLSNGDKLVRTMVKQGLDTAGVLRYTWIATDWDAASSPDVNGSYQVGGLIAGPSLPLSPSDVEHRMEYEVVGPGTVRLTFPNDGYDILRVTSDIGQG